MERKIANAVEIVSKETIEADIRVEIVFYKHKKNSIATYLFNSVEDIQKKISKKTAVNLKVTILPVFDDSNNKAEFILKTIKNPEQAESSWKEACTELIEMMEDINFHLSDYDMGTLHCESIFFRTGELVTFPDEKFQQDQKEIQKNSIMF